MLVHDPASGTPEKIEFENITHFRAITQEFLSLLDVYKETHPEKDPTLYFSILDSLLHHITDLGTILGLVQLGIKEDRLIHNQVLSK